MKTGGKQITFFTRGMKKNPGIYRLVSLTSVPGKAMAQLILETTSRHVKDKNIIRKTLRGFTKQKSHLTCLLCFYDAMTGLIDEERTMDIAFLNFSKSFL